MGAMFLAGCVVGLIIGVLATLAFCWLLCKEAERKYKEADRYWQNGTAEYEKAVRVLNNVQAHYEQRTKGAKEAWAKVVAILTVKYPELDNDPELAGALKPLDGPE